MTVQEAIKRLESKRKGAVAILDSGFGTHQGESDIVYRSRKELCDICISALEKQIPKKPIEKGIKGLKISNTAFCPICDSPVIKDEADNYEQAYCCYCGQALDWSGDNDKT